MPTKVFFQLGEKVGIVWDWIRTLSYIEKFNFPIASWMAHVAWNFLLVEIKICLIFVSKCWTLNFSVATTSFQTSFWGIIFQLIYEYYVSNCIAEPTMLLTYSAYINLKRMHNSWFPKFSTLKKSTILRPCWRQNTSVCQFLWKWSQKAFCSHTFLLL